MKTIRTYECSICHKDFTRESFGPAIGKKLTCGSECRKVKNVGINKYSTDENRKRSYTKVGRKPIARKCEVCSQEFFTLYKIKYVVCSSTCFENLKNIKANDKFFNR